MLISWGLSVAQFHLDSFRHLLLKSLSRGIPRESDVEGGKQSGDMYVYMFFKDDYGWHEAQCAGQTNTVQVKSSHSALQNNHKFLPGAKDISFHNNELAGKYKAATVIDLATVSHPSPTDTYTPTHPRPHHM